MNFQTIFVALMAGVIGSLLTYLIIPKQKEQYSLKNAVIAFNSSEKCPTGWREYSEASGRFILAAGTGDGLTKRKSGDTGGSEEIEIAYYEFLDEERLSQIDNQISLNFLSTNSYKFDRNMVITPDEEYEKIYKYIIPNKMPPFITLRFCINQMK